MSSESIIALNVGGVHFDTTRATLEKCGYFEAYFERWPQKVGDRLFLDRSGNLFAHLLEFMRTSNRPSNEIIAAHKDALIEDCLFLACFYLSFETFY